mmetsp:Transcript_29233/g.70464  ORF Transcript_29233/g.70464 Transcript_29233/m.70464 type:complete len:127 (+) Transcript_29233:18-398(+)
MMTMMMMLGADADVEDDSRVSEPQSRRRQEEKWCFSYFLLAAWFVRLEHEQKTRRDWRRRQLGDTLCAKRSYGSYGGRGLADFDFFVAGRLVFHLYCPAFNVSFHFSVDIPFRFVASTQFNRNLQF